VLAFFALNKFLHTPAEIISKQVKKVLWIILALTIIFLTISGKLNSIFAIIGLGMAYLFRILPQIVRYLPHLHSLWASFKKTQRPTNSTPPPASSKMTPRQAYEILGLTASATQQEIIQAHKRLIQKVHPDRGGSDYLAAQINQAKKVLLNNKV